ncbi:hypothetical protein GOP47_0010683, partial [Adiantum capillus-veneris]
VCEELDPKLSGMKKDVVILEKVTHDVDNDFFLVLVKILDHHGVLFPLRTLQNLKSHLDRMKNAAFVKRTSDFTLASCKVSKLICHNLRKW